MRILALLPGLLLAAALAAAAPASAPVPDELDRDWFAATLEAGYSGYAFPINDPALARTLAAGSGLAWQVAFDHSTIPVRMNITHRRGAAFRGRVEVTATPSYPAVEDPQGRPATVSREFIAPPSVPTSVMLAPRVCPPSEPGAPVQIEVRLYQQGVAQPVFKQQAEVIQLEPAHLYSLRLDAPDERIASQWINPGNRWQLAIYQSRTRKPMIAPELLTSRHYILPVNRRQVTCLPLAACQFAFVIADAAAVRDWPEEEQRALAEYLLGGGHLCLYNAAGQWQGLDFAAGAQPAGRGNLLPVAGGYPDAEATVQRWLEGELAELTLWLGGSCQGFKLELPGGRTNWGPGGALDAAYGPASHDGELLARRPGFLHPLYLYRETCRASALEPWDYPEFLSPARHTLLSNPNLRTLKQVPQDDSYRPAADFAAAGRPVSGRLLLITGLVLLPALLAGFTRRRAAVWLPAGLACAGCALWLWHGQPPLQEQPIRVAVYDQDARLPAAVCRELQAVQTGPAGEAAFPLDQNALVRHVAWQPPGGWQWGSTLDGARWQGSGGGPYVALSTTAPVAPQALPVLVNTTCLPHGRVLAEFDTSKLAADERCFLQTPLGWQIIPGGQPRVTYELHLPHIPAEPGAARLRAIQNFLDSRLDTSVQDWLSISDLIQDCAITAAALPTTGTGQLKQLALGGLVQLPTDFRGTDWRQLVLIAPLASTDPAREVAFVRYSIPLEVR